MKNDINKSSNLSMVLSIKADQFNSITNIIKIIKENFKECNLSIIDSEKFNLKNVDNKKNEKVIVKF